MKNFEKKNFLENRSKSLILKKYENFLTRKIKQKNYSLFVKKNYLPKLTKNGKIRLKTRIFESKEKKKERYKKEIFEKQKKNFSKKKNYLKNSILLIKEIPKPKFTNFFIEKNLSKNSKIFSEKNFFLEKNLDQENILRNSVYYKNYLPFVKKKNFGEKKNLNLVLKKMKKKKKIKKILKIF